MQSTIWTISPNHHVLSANVPVPLADAAALCAVKQRRAVGTQERVREVLKRDDPAEQFTPS